MNLPRIHFPRLFLVSAWLSSGNALCNDIILPEPDRKGGKPLMEALQERPVHPDPSQTAPFLSRCFPPSCGLPRASTARTWITGPRRHPGTQ